MVDFVVQSQSVGTLLTPSLCPPLCSAAAAGPSGGRGREVGDSRQAGAEARYIADASLDWARFEGFKMPIPVPPGAAKQKRVVAVGRHRHHVVGGTARAASSSSVNAGRHAYAEVTAVQAAAPQLAASGGFAAAMGDARVVRDVVDHVVHGANSKVHIKAEEGRRMGAAVQQGKHAGRSNTLSAVPAGKLAEEAEGWHAEDGAGGGDATALHPFNPREAAGTLQAYMGAHPDFASVALAWVVVGLVLFFLAIVTLVFSEVRVILVVRDQDFRRDMSKGGYMDETDKLGELESREADTVAARPYLTAGSIIVQFVASVCFLKPFCDVLDIIGLPSSNCVLTVSFGSFVLAVTTTTFIMGLCWSCTRVSLPPHEPDWIDRRRLVL